MPPVRMSVTPWSTPSHSLTPRAIPCEQMAPQARVTRGRVTQQRFRRKLTAGVATLGTSEPDVAAPGGLRKANEPGLGQRITTADEEGEQDRPYSVRWSSSPTAAGQSHPRGELSPPRGVKVTSEPEKTFTYTFWVFVLFFNPH